MSGVGFSELILLFLIGLIVLGPERLPRVANQLGSWLGQARRMTRVMRRQLEEELDLDAKPASKTTPAARSVSNPETTSQASAMHGPLDAEPTHLARNPANEEDDTWSPAHGAADTGTGVGDEPAVTEPVLPEVADAADDAAESNPGTAKEKVS